MLFNSFGFLALIAITFTLYYIPTLKSSQREILITASLVFYAVSRPTLLLILLSVILITTFTSYIIYKGTIKYRKLYATLGVTFNLGILAFFKYSPMIGKTFFPIEDSIGNFLLTVPLPVGISFYIFKSITLVVDVYREKNNYRKDAAGLVPHDIMNHALNAQFYISFFPQLLAGPISKAQDFIPQIGVKLFKDIDWERCFKMLVLGYFLKMVIADNLKEQTANILFPYFQGFSSLTLLTILLGYSVQMFSDFAGYSLIAIAVSGLFGYKIKENFNYPYISRSFTEFWRRWHISLSTFLRDYLYIPLGGNRKGKWWTYINLMIVMVLGGLWHGSAWSFAAWGFFHGFALATERFVKDRIELPKTKFVRFVRILFVFSFVSVAWIFFKLTNFYHVIKYFESILKNPINTPPSHIGIITIAYSTPVFLYHLFYLYKERLTFLRKNEYIIYGLLLFFILTNSGSPNNFLYFMF